MAGNRLLKTTGNRLLKTAGTVLLKVSGYISLKDDRCVRHGQRARQLVVQGFIRVFSDDLLSEIILIWPSSQEGL